MESQSQPQSQSQPPVSPQAPPPITPATKKGMSGGMKFVFCCGCAALFFLAVLLGVAGYGYYYWQKKDLGSFDYQQWLEEYATENESYYSDNGWYDSEDDSNTSDDNDSESKPAPKKY
ncbi:hypothetical protein KJ903_05910 [Patescibacteria group bacterium]|nr:hypothetical protein [Patescibacteria group bacterium]